MAPTRRGAPSLARKTFSRTSRLAEFASQSELIKLTGHHANTGRPSSLRN